MLIVFLQFDLNNEGNERDVMFVMMTSMVVFLIVITDRWTYKSCHTSYS